MTIMDHDPKRELLKMSLFTIGGSGGVWFQTLLVNYY